MAFRLKLDRGLGPDVRRVLAAQAKVVASRLTGKDATIAVHEARKGIKRMRALLRLVATGLAPDHFSSMNTALRDIARGLSGARDRAALTQACAELAATTDGQRQLASDLERAKRLISQSPTAKAPASAIAAALQEIARFRRSVRKVEIVGAADDVVVSGLRATYRRGQKALAKARASQSDSDYHELRKHIQAHWRQMALVTPAWPDEFSARASTAKSLSANLGLDHDLAILAEFTRTSSRDQLPEAAARRIATACETRQHALRAVAALDLDRLFAERPRDFEARMRHYLDTAIRAHAKPS